MKGKFLKITVFLTALMMTLSFQPQAMAAAPAAKSYQSLVVSYWPEYDSQSVLGIFRGKLPSNVKLPAKVKIFIPKGARVSSTAAVDTSGQYQYDQAWNSHTVTPGADYDVLEYETVFPEFQTEIYFSPVGQATARTFDFKFKSPVDIGTLDIEVQKPSEATEYKVEPVSSNINNRENFEYHNYSFTDVPADKEIGYKVTYNKVNNKPSVNTQQGQVNTTGGGTTNVGGGRGNTIMIMAIIFGLLGTGIAVGVWRSRTTTAAAPAGKQFKTPKYGKSQKNQRPKPKKDKHCGNCGEKLAPNAQFCTGCGAKVG